MESVLVATLWCWSVLVATLHPTKLRHYCELRDTLARYCMDIWWHHGSYHPFTKFLGNRDMGLFHPSSWAGFEFIGAKVPFLKRFGWQCRDHKEDVIEWSGKGLEEGFKNETLGPVWRNRRPLAKAVLWQLLIKIRGECVREASSYFSTLGSKHILCSSKIQTGAALAAYVNLWDRAISRIWKGEN